MTSLSSSVIDIYHNILWSKYKGHVFARIHEKASERVSFFQIAETDSAQALLTGVDLRYHRYPFQLLYKGAYSAIPKMPLTWRLFRQVLTSKAQLVLLPGYHLPEYWGMLLAAMLRGKKRAVFCDSTIHDRPQGLVRGLLKRLFFRRMDGFFAYGERSSEYLQSYGCDPQKIYRRCQAAAMPIGFSFEDALKRRLVSAPDKDHPRFLYVGRLAPEKGLLPLIHAFQQVQRKLPRATLTLVGSGPLLESLQNEVRRLDLRNVIFGGSKGLDELVHDYAAATCLVLPSFSEPWGLVVNEALSCGCPVVVSDLCGCVPELVENQPTGLVIQPGDVNDIADKLLTAVDRFADTESKARLAQSLISTYTADAAASSILNGCERMLRS